MALTHLKVERSGPRRKLYEEGDGGGLYLRVHPTGNKSWLFRYVFGGERRRMTLGSYPSMSLAEAREAHGKALADVKRGIDPGAQALDAKRARKAAPTFHDLLEEFWERELKATKSGPERKRLVEKDALPAWRTRKAKDITRRDIVILMDEVRDRAPVTANRLLGVLARMFNFAAERGIIEDSPATRIRRPSEAPRVRVLNDDELRLFWHGLEEVDVYPATRLVLRMILLTGQRPGEVTGMTWEEIDGDWWTIPANRMKGGQEHRVPLTPLALEAIEEAKRYAGNRPFVFASSQQAARSASITVHSLSRGVLRHRAEMGIHEHYTPHDLRRTCRTRLAEIGIDDVVAEKVLGHQLQGILKVYNRHSYDTEKRAALMAWENRLRRVLGLEVEGAGKVINLR
ncbi:tyrosine-type recombinase/integrase [Fundidesulfovibrio putealis]|uniref:tyrosine-type recombinase/integrase n=1 Tax=Fundidesulfovibrio putealis TaxID=270496 RepID=UPI00041049AF|nr:site-specific integrase [Fundidesulfovibrio putealis]